MLDQKWIIDCNKSNINKKKFEENVFGSLINKMGYSTTDLNNWKDVSIYLYIGNEINENI